MDIDGFDPDQGDPTRKPAPGSRPEDKRVTRTPPQLLRSLSGEYQ